MASKPSESAIIAAYAEAEHVRDRFRGHDDSWIIATLWRRVSEARREAGLLRNFEGKVETALRKLEEKRRTHGG